MTVNSEPSSSTAPPSAPLRANPGAGPVDVGGGVQLWTEMRGAGSDVLLLAGLGDTVEAWSAQLDGLGDRHRLIAFDNRSAGRSPDLPEGATVADLADDAAAVLRALGGGPVHVAGFSGGSATAQELALRHPALVRSLVLVSTWARLDAYARAVTDVWAWSVEVAPSERAMLEAFFVWIYTTPRAHDNGLVGDIVGEALAFEHPQSPDGFRRQLAAWTSHDTLDRLHRIAVPTLVVAGELDVLTPPRLGRAVAQGIPGAKFVVLDGEAHQPFQESAGEFNALVADFWARVETSAAER